MPDLAVEGDRQIYYEHYRGSGRPVVLIHGWAMGARCWDTTVAALIAHGHAVVAYDQRCCAQSDKDFADVSVDANGSDVVKLVDALGLERPVLNGWSFGGAVAMDAATKLGDNISGLVLTSGATPRYTSAPDWPYGGTIDDVAGTLGALATARVDTLMAVASAVCIVDVGPNTVHWLWEPAGGRGAREPRRHRSPRGHAPTHHPGASPFGAPRCLRPLRRGRGVASASPERSPGRVPRVRSCTVPRGR